MIRKQLIFGAKNNIGIFILFIIIILSLSQNYFNLNQLCLDNDLLIGTLEHFQKINHMGVRSNSNYTYHNYSTFVTDLNELNTNYPELIEIFTTQEQFGLPDCEGGYKIWVARITNEKVGSNKPEILFVGGHHGDEGISIETPYYLIEFLLENYASNASIRYLVDHREIYIIPVINPWGWENNKREDFNNEDVNRDYPYGIETGNTPLTTVGAQSVAELMKRHLFILSLSWHSGEHLIYYAWGTPKHDTTTDESPDNLAFFEVAKLMSENSGDVDKYPFGPANQMFYYSAFGAWSDYAYAAGWDLPNVATGYVTPGGFSLALGIEISKTKVPNQALLGNSQEILSPNGNIGLISQNIRMALVMLDLVEPYLSWQNSALNPIPAIANINTNITLSWFVNGSFSVTETNLLYGTDPDPIKNFQFSTESLSGDSHWTENAYTQELTLPSTPGNYYFVAHAVVDQQALIQNDPEPDLLPQSFFVNQRTNDSWKVTNNENILKGNRDWYSSVISIKVVSDAKNQVWITKFDDEGYCNEPFKITWNIMTDGILNHTELYWGLHQDPINHSSHKTTQQKSSEEEYEATITIPERPGHYFFIAHLNILPNTSNSSKDATDFWSQIISVEAFPKTPYELDVTIQSIEYINGFQQTLSVTGITCSNYAISDYPLDNSLMIEHNISISRIDTDFKNNTSKQISTNINNYGLNWFETEDYWYLPSINISAWAEGEYLVICYFKHRYGQGHSDDTIHSINRFTIQHSIIVDQPTIMLIGNDTKYLDIWNVTSICSKEQISSVTETEANIHSYQIINLSSQQIVLSGNLSWSLINNSWERVKLNITNLTPGEYFVTCIFGVYEIASTGESPHFMGDKTEFTILTDSTHPGSENEIEPEPNEIENYTPFIIVILILIIVTFFILWLLRIRKKY